jgi:hypothetical protein
MLVSVQWYQNVHTTLLVNEIKSGNYSRYNGFDVLIAVAMKITVCSCVVRWKLTDVSEEHATIIFRIEE